MNEPAQKPLIEIRGYCPVCEQNTVYTANSVWFRDNLFCSTCHNGSIPRERAMMKVLKQMRPNWQELMIHECSPIGRGPTARFMRECKGYVGSHYFADIPAGEMSKGYVSQDIEAQTFPDEAFDIVITQDVMEHVFHPARAHQEIWRTLKPGGLHIFTTPIMKDLVKSRIVAEIKDGTVTHLEPPEYHGNPIDEKGSLVTVVYGYDIADTIVEAAPFDVEVRRFNDRTAGILGELTEVIVCAKR